MTSESNFQNIADQLRQGIQQYNPDDELIQTLAKLAEALEALSNGSDNQPLADWAHNYGVWVAKLSQSAK
jgi:hypothetical protein